MRAALMIIVRSDNVAAAWNDFLQSELQGLLYRLGHDHVAGGPRRVSNGQLCPSKGHKRS